MDPEVVMDEVFKTEDVFDMLDAYAIAKSSEKNIQELTFQLKNILINCCPSYLARNLMKVVKKTEEES